MILSVPLPLLLLIILFIISSIFYFSGFLYGTILLGTLLICISWGRLPIGILLLPTKRKVTNTPDEVLFKPPPPIEECPICFVTMPSHVRGKRYNGCCGKVICGGCCAAVQIRTKGFVFHCPFCRTRRPTSDEDMLKRERKRIDNHDDPLAIYNTASSYKQGDYGFPIDHAKSLELYLRAGKLGYANAYYRAGIFYAFGGDGVEIDLDAVDLDVDPATKKVSVKPKGTIGSQDPKSLIKPGSKINIGD